MLNSMPRRAAPVVPLTLPVHAASSVPGTSAATAGPARTRLSPAERRRQLVGIGLRKFVEHPVLELSLDAVAAEAGVSRGLLFHYFPTKTDFHRAVVAAAGRRVLRTVTPDEGVTGAAAVEQLVERFVDQIDRRRPAYLALVYGQGLAPTRHHPPDLDEHGHLDEPADAQAGTAVTLRAGLTQLVMAAARLPASKRGIVHAWVAYVEDRALVWSDPDRPRRGTRRQLVTECARALTSLTSTQDH